MKKYYLFLLFTSVTLWANAQKLDSTISQNYSTNVIIRVHDIATKVVLTTSLQVSIADLFDEEENTLATLIINGALPKILDSAKRAYKTAFHQLLSAEQRDEYYNKSNASKVNTTARLNSLVLKNKYQTGTTYQNYFNQILNWREQQLALTWEKNIDTNIRNNNIYNTIWAYDSVLNLYTHAASGYQFAAARLHFLDSIMPIDSNKKNNVFSKYYDICISHPNRSFADNFKDAFSQFFNAAMDTPYYVALYPNHINYTTQNAVATAIANYVQRDNLSTNALQQLMEPLYQRERVTTIINLMHPNYTIAKDSLLDTLTFVYQKAINQIIGSSGSLVNPSQIDIALHYAEELAIEPVKISELQNALSGLHNNIEQYKQQNPMGEYDSKAFESQALSSILSPEQYTQVLTTKYLNIATNMANRMWLYMVQKNRIEGLSEAETKTELTNYYLAIIIAHYRNAHLPETQFTAVSSIREIMPRFLKTIIQEWEFRAPYSDTPDTFFQW
jgi:hypothetical protein